MKPLTPRQIEVVALMAEGHNYEGIGERLFVTGNAIRNRLVQMYEQLEIEADHPSWRLIALYASGQIPTEDTPAIS